MSAGHFGVMDATYGLNGSPGDSADEAWRSGGTPSASFRHLEIGQAAVCRADSPLCGSEVGMNTLAFPPLEFDSLPGSLSMSSCPPHYRDYTFFRTEKSPHDIADALLSLKHAVVHPQLSGPLSPLTSPPMPHLSHAHCTSGQGLSPYPAMPSPVTHSTQGMSPGFVSGHNYGHSQSMLHNYSVGVEVGVGSQLPPQYGLQYQDQCPSPTSQIPPPPPPPPHPHHPAPPHPSQTGMSFPAMSVNVSMSMNVGVPPNMGAGAYNCGPSHQQWPPPPPPPSAQSLSPTPLSSQYHYQSTGPLHSNWLQSAPSQYPGYSHSQFPGSQAHHHVMSPYPPSSYSLTSDLRGSVSTDSRGVYYHKAAATADSFKDPSRYCSVRHPHHHLIHEHNHNTHMGGLGKRTRFLSDKVAMVAAAAAAVSVSSAGAAGMIVGMGGVADGVSHLSGHHPAHQGLLKTNLCRICGKTYARPSTLKTHLRTHSGEKPYKCSTCGKSFSQAANLTAHIRTHSGEKPFRCPICDRRFSQSSSVTTHMRTHSGDRPYRCRLCKKAFSDSSTLTKHLRIHSGEKPYQCKLCLLRFSQSGNLNRHMRVHANQT